MRAVHSSFILSGETMTWLRHVFEECLDSEEEVAGIFRVKEEEGDKKELLFEKNGKSNGREGRDWTASSTTDAPFTWHTHPVLFGKTEGASPSNFGSSVMASGEDLLGLVQDNVRNSKNFLANPTGQNVFDCILTVAGILVIGASQESVELWEKMSIIDKSNMKEWISEYGLEGKMRRRGSLSISTVKAEIEKVSFAKVENAFNFIAFKKYCGAYGYFGKGAKSDTVFERIWRQCPFIGYHTWWPTNLLPKDEKTIWDTSTPENRMNSVKHVQKRWFKSKTFLETNVIVCLLIILFLLLVSLDMGR
jgi:hypothetical protein